MDKKRNNPRLPDREDSGGAAEKEAGGGLAIEASPEPVPIYE